MSNVALLLVKLEQNNSSMKFFLFKEFTHPAGVLLYQQILCFDSKWNFHNNSHDFISLAAQSV